MLRTRALALVLSAACVTAGLTACERSATAPPAPRASVASVAPGLEDGATVTSRLVDHRGAIVELSAGRARLYARLTVPAGALDVPAYVDVGQELTGDLLTLRIAARPASKLAPSRATQNFTDDPIVLSLSSAGGGAHQVRVVFSPPDGSEAIVTSASLRAGQVTTVGFRRGRSKYSVIYF